MSTTPLQRVEESYLLRCPMIFGSIYRITNLVNSKVYIGQTIDLVKRKQMHFNGHNKSCPAIHAAVKKYGKENFIFEILFSNIPFELLDEYEIVEIRKHDSVVPNGYNMNLGGSFKSELTSQKISKAKKGKKRSIESRQKMSIGQKRRYACPNERKKVTERNLNRNPEVNQRIGNTLRGRKNSPCSEETKRKIGNANRGKKRTEEAKAKMRDAWRKRKEKNTLQLSLFDQA